MTDREQRAAEMRTLATDWENVAKSAERVFPSPANPGDAYPEARLLVEALRGWAMVLAFDVEPLAEAAYNDCVDAALREEGKVLKRWHDLDEESKGAFRSHDARLLATLKAERDEFQRANERLERERDEARDRALKMLRERDAAVAETEKVRDRKRISSEVAAEFIGIADAHVAHDVRAVFSALAKEVPDKAERDTRLRPSRDEVK
jgi:hypothetical protein